MQRRSNPPPASAPGPLVLEEFLPYRLSILSNTVSGAIAGAYAETFGLSIPEWRVMAVVAIYPGLSAQEVAERTAMDKVAVSRAVSRLLGARRLNRRFDQNDRRRSILELSAEGRSIYGQITPLAQGYEQALLAELDGEERQRLDGLLRKLLSRALELGPLRASSMRDAGAGEAAARPASRSDAAAD